MQDDRYIDRQLALEAALLRLQSPHGDVRAWRDQVLAEMQLTQDDFDRLAPLCEAYLSNHPEELRAPLSGALLLGFLFGSAFAAGDTA